LEEEIKFLTNYFELERIRLEDRFSYTINTKGIKNMERLKVPNMVIQPFVENAIKHGVRYKKNGKGFIEVVFEQPDDTLRCTIADNGIGREKAMQLRSQSGVQHESKGMGITFRRIESVNALTKGNINITIEDLKDENGNASGTKVVIDFYKINEYHDKDSNNR
jgi:sensor histidine kinase YesM